MSRAAICARTSRGTPNRSSWPRRRGELASVCSAHVLGARLDADAAEVEPVGVPARADRRVVGCLATCVSGARVAEQLELLIADFEEHTTKIRGIGCAAGAVSVVRIIIDSTAVVEHGEQFYDVHD